MDELTLRIMTRDLCHRYFQEFQVDMDLFADKSKYQPYVYDRTECNTYFDRYVRLGRVHMAIMLGEEPIGELILKNIDKAKGACEMGISMKTDSFKNQGYGTRAEILALEYAFFELKMETVCADALLKNTRSQHVLKKIGFLETHRDDRFVYFRCDKHTWNAPDS